MDCGDYHIRRQLLALPFPEREVLTYRVLEGLPSREVADRLNLSEVEVRRLLRIGLRALHQATSAPSD